MRDYFNEAIRLLRPTAEFVMYNRDYSTIEWHVLEGDAPTLEEIENAIILIKESDANEETQQIAARQALLDKLGITEEEAKLLLS